MKKIKKRILSICLCLMVIGSFGYEVKAANADTTVAYVAQGDDGSGNISVIDTGKPVKTGDCNETPYLVGITLLMGSIILLMSYRKYKRNV